LLNEAGIRPRHVWGQNFLIDLNLMRLLVDRAQLRTDDTVLEVGCGTGSLTDLLAQKTGTVIAVEIDRQLAKIAQSQLQSHGNIQWFHNDVLVNKSTLQPAVIAAVTGAQKGLAGRFLLVANLPYQAAAPLLINLILSEKPPDRIIVTVQAEVADRMTATPGTKAYGSLSILMQATGLVKQFRTIKPQAFWPRPKVNSAMVSYQRAQEMCAKIKNIAALKRLIDRLLGQRRKKIKTCLAQDNAMTQIIPQFIDPNARGETLGVDKFVALSQLQQCLPSAFVTSQ